MMDDIMYEEQVRTTVRCSHCDLAAPTIGECRACLENQWEDTVDDMDSE